MRQNRALHGHTSVAEELKCLNYCQPAKAMHRIPLKPSLENMPSCISDERLAVTEYQQYGGCHRLPQTKENIRTLLSQFPLGIEIGKFAVRYHEAYEEELIPQAFGFQNLMEMLKSLYDLVDLKAKVQRARKIVIAKPSKSKGSDTACKIDKKQKQGKNHLLLLLIKERISRLMEWYPHGVYMEKMSTAYKIEYGEELVPQTFGFPHLEKMLWALQDIVEIKVKQPEEMRWMLHMKVVKKKDEGKPEQVNPNTTPLHDIVEIFHSIINNLGGIEVDSLIPEYEARTGQKLNVQELGFVSLPSFLSQMSEVLKTLKKDGKVFLVDSNLNFQQPSESQDLTCTVAAEADSQSDARALMNLRQLIEEEFPYGLRLDELYAAYEGFYGMSREDLDYEKHGYGSLEAFLAAKPDIVTLLNHQGSVYVLPTQPFMSPNPEQINSSYTGRVVGQDERYSVVGKLPPGPVEVVVGEVYTPQLFWVMHYGQNTSMKLDTLMDGMLDFYGSSLGERYRLQERQVTNHMPVAALYSPDNNFYRAFVLSVEDLRTVKLFFVDYGTICISTYDSVRLLHAKFFELPAQAIKCSLYGVLPANQKCRWGRKCSKRFLVMVQNQRLKAEVMDEQITTVIKLWDTSHGEDTSIAELLVREGLAAPGNTCDADRDPCASETLVTSSDVQRAQITQKDLEAVPNTMSYLDAQAGYVTSTQEQPTEVGTNTALYVDVQGSSVPSTLEESIEVAENAALGMDVQENSVASTQKQRSLEGVSVSNRTSNMAVQRNTVTSTQKQASGGSVPSTREDQTDTIGLEAILGTESNIGFLHGSSVSCAEERPFGGSLPSTRKAEANTAALSPIGPSERNSCNSSFQLAAADSQYLVSSTPKRSLFSQPSNSCKCGTEEDTQAHSDLVFLNDNFLVQPMDITINRTLRVIQMDDLPYVLDADLPYVRHDQVEHLGITLKKESDQNIYLNLVENGFDIFEPSGKFRPWIVIYPLTHLPAILAYSGYHMDGCDFPNNNESKESSSGNVSTELIKMEENSSGPLPCMETSRDSSFHSESVESRTFYRHGAQVEPLRRPFPASELGYEH